MKKNTSLVIAIVLVLTLIFSALPVQAFDATPEKTYTYDEIMAILSMQYDVSEITQNGSLTFNSQNFPMNISTYSLSIPSGTYYICFKDSGNMLTNSSNSIGQSSYSSSNSYQKWTFNEVSDGFFNIFMYNDSSKCLTANNGSVSIENYVSQNSNQLWSIEISASGNYLVSKSNGQYLYSNGNSYVLSTTSRSYFGFFNLNSNTWNPPYSISMNNIDNLVLGNNRYMYPTTVGPQGTSTSEFNWIDFSVVNGASNTVSISNNIATGQNIGIVRVQAQHRITKVSCYFQITVQPMQSNLNVIPVEQEKSNWCWAACAEMIGRFYNPTGYRTQQQVADYCMSGENLALPFSNQLIISVIMYAANNNINHEISAIDSTNAQEICRKLSLNYPIWIALSNVQKGGHAIVLIGCTLSGNYESTTYTFSYIDPAYGVVRTCTYDDMINGTMNGLIGYTYAGGLA